MSQERQSQTSERARGGEVYSVGDQRAQLGIMDARMAQDWVPFLLPHLRPGMSLLDCGCGPGSITLDLAARVAPGQVVGVDLDESQLAVARTEAARRGLTNVRFEVASVYDLPFPDASFDAAVAHTLLQHLGDPLRALKAMRRVLKPGGVIGVSDDDFGTTVISPADPHMERLMELWVQVIEHNGGSPYYARHLRGLLREAGFAKTEGHAVTAEYHGTLAATRKHAANGLALFRDPTVTGPILSEGWADEAELERTYDSIQAWGEHPDAFMAWMYCAAIGWVGEEPD